MLLHLVKLLLPDSFANLLFSEPWLQVEDSSQRELTTAKWQLSTVNYLPFNLQPTANCHRSPVNVHPPTTQYNLQLQEGGCEWELEEPGGGGGRADPQWCRGQWGGVLPGTPHWRAQGNTASLNYSNSCVCMLSRFSETAKSGKNCYIQCWSRGKIKYAV